MAHLNLWMRPRSERYRKLSFLGSGSFGTVTMALDELTNRRVALKEQSLASPGCQREFALLAALNAHPSPFVSTMLDYFTVTRPLPRDEATVSDRGVASAQKSTGTVSDRGVAHLVTVHPLGDSTLWHLFRGCLTRDRGGISDSILATLMYGVARGLGHLHQLSIVHGDASLKNMLLGPNNIVQVADVGSAHSAMGFFLGAEEERTTKYVRSPERILGDTAPTWRTDVWAFGVQLFCLRAGRCPWLGTQGELDDGPHLTELTKVLGPVPSPLHQLPKYGTLSECCAGASTESFSNWSQESKALLGATFCWDPPGRVPMLEACRTFPYLNLRSAMLPVAVGQPPSDAHSDSLELPSRNGLGPQELPSNGGGLEPPCRNSLELRKEMSRDSGDSVALPSGASDAPKQQSRFSAPPKSLARSASSSVLSDSPCSTSAVVEPLSTQTTGQRCQCSGNCGSRLHKSRANNKVRMRDKLVICAETPKFAGAKFCVRCSCEIMTCTYARRSTRWCNQHAMQLKKNEYALPSGKLTMEPTWPADVRVLAKIAHILPYVVPGDVTVLLRWLSDQQIFVPDRAVLPGEFAVLFIAHLIKWPPAVEHWFRLVAEFDLQQVTTKKLADAFISVLRFCDDKPWREMFDRMSGGLMDAQTGLAVMGIRLGVLKKKVKAQQLQRVPSRRAVETDVADATPPKRKRSLAKTSQHAPSGADDAAEITTLRLGRASTEYELLPSTTGIESVVDFVLSTAVDVPAFPRGVGEVEAFADDLLGMIRKLRNFKGEGGAQLKGGHSPEHAYSARHLLRIILLHIDRSWNAAFDSLTFKRITDWCPDERNHAEGLGPTVSAGWVREKFGMSPFMWHAWMCLLNFGDAPLQQCIEKGEQVVWEAFNTYEMTQTGASDDFPPGPHKLLASLALPTMK